MRKKTHEQFLEELKIKNYGYRNGEIKIMSEYECIGCLMQVMTKFGLCMSLPDNLLKNKSPTIKSAINKSEFFRNMCYDKFGEYGNDDLSEIEYVGIHTKIKVKCKLLGKCYYVTPNNYYYAGVRFIKGRLDKEYVFNKIKEINPDLELLPNQVYTNNNTNLLLKSKYGVISVQPHYLFKAYTPTIRVAVNKTEYFINQAKEIHGDRYDYSLVEYVHSHSKVKIICELGIFEQTPDIHLQGSISKIESTEFQRKTPPAWSYSAWQASAEKSKHFTGYKVYFIECWDDETNERFYKIGRTYRHIGKRLKNSVILYSYKILKIIESEDAREICELEKMYKDNHKEFKYLPNKKFGGMHECFSKLIIKP